MVQASTENACKFCGEFISATEKHEEFDFYKHPNVKGQLRALNEKYKALPLNERLYQCENYAVRRGLRLGAKIVEEKGHKRPEGGRVIHPAYTRLIEADIWLAKMIASEQSKVSNTLTNLNDGLPF